MPRLAPQHLYVALAAASLPLRLLARNWFAFFRDGSLLGAIRILSCSPAILRLNLMPICFWHSFSRCRPTLFLAKSRPPSRAAAPRGSQHRLSRCFTRPLGLLISS